MLEQELQRDWAALTLDSVGSARSYDIASNVGCILMRHT